MSDTRISDEAVKKTTGKIWKEWFSILDDEDSTSKPHKEIASWLSKNFDISGWWCQMITVQYERERGMREVHEKKDGFEAGKSKTFYHPIERVYKAWQDETVRKKWFEGPDFEIRTSTENKSIRITWPDQTNAEVYFTVKGEGKTQISIQHNKLPAASEVKERKKYWQKQINRLADFLDTQK